MDVADTPRRVREVMPSVGQTARMSPVSRSRGKQNKRGKQSKRSTRRSAPPAVVRRPTECDCPACAGEGIDPKQLIDELVAAAVDLVELDDPLDAEILGAAFVSIGAGAGEAFEEALVGGFIPQLEARATTEALAMLLAMGAVAAGRGGKEASVAAERLVEAGVTEPEWAAELGQPVTAGDCCRLVDSQDTMSVLACSFHRAERSHAIVLAVDHTDCGAADHILVVDADQLPEALEMLRGRRPPRRPGDHHPDPGCSGVPLAGGEGAGRAGGARQRAAR